MSAYMSAVIAVAAVTALVGMISPGDGAVKRYIKYISGLVMLSVIATPLIDALTSPIELPEFSQSGGIETYEYNIREEIIKRAEQSLSDTVKDDLIRVFRINNDDIAVIVSLDSTDFDNIKIDSVTVTLRSYGAWTDTESIENYISENYDCEAQIRYE